MFLHSWEEKLKYETKNINILALIAGGIYAHKVYYSFYSTTEKQLKSQDWILAQI